MDTADLHTRSLIFLRSIMFVSCDSFVDVKTLVPFSTANNLFRSASLSADDEGIAESGI